MPRVIPRDFYLNKLIDRRENGLVKVITGVRRCGKSFLLFKLFRDYLLESGIPDNRIVAIALDDDSHARYRDPAELSAFIRERISGKEMHYVFIDEVQYAISRDELRRPGDIRLYDVLNGLLRLGNTDIYVTGSNSKMLTRDVMTAFRGRGDEVRIYPLSFGEYRSFAGGEKAEAYEEYALFGGMPLVLSRNSDEDKAAYLKGLFDEVYFKDIVERYDIQMPDVLDELSSVLCSSIGSLTNASKIANTVRSAKGTRVSPATIANYLRYLEESFLFSNARRYDVKGKRYFEYPSKYYCADPGLRNARLNFRQQDESHIMENILYNELIRRGYSVDVGIVEIVETRGGRRTKKQCEIDFVVNRGPRKYYVQSALNTGDPRTLERELRPLKHDGDFFRRIVVTKTGTRPWIDEDGILRAGLYDFLLDENSLDS